MAAIAKFVSFDGGIAFSDTVLKIQKRDEERGRFIPIESITGLEVDEPLLGDDGCVRIRIAGKRPSARDAIYFDEEQYSDALDFKAAFDSFTGQAAPALPPLEMFQPTSIATRPQRAQTRYTQPEGPRRPARQTRHKRGFKWWYAVLALLAIGVVANIGGEDEKDAAQEESASYAVAEVTASPEPTAEPTPEATAGPTPEPAPVVGYTSAPIVTEPPATQAPVQTETMVWIPTNGGTKYHRTSGCSNMDDPQYVTLSEAEARGFTACKRCY